MIMFWLGVHNNMVVAYKGSIFIGSPSRPNKAHRSPCYKFLRDEYVIMTLYKDLIMMSQLRHVSHVINASREYTSVTREWAPCEIQRSLTWAPRVNTHPSLHFRVETTPYRISTAQTDPGFRRTRSAIVYLYLKRLIFFFLEKTKYNYF